MLRLFFRIFLICLSALIVVSLLSILWRDNTFDHQRGESIANQHQELAQEVYRTLGLKGLKRWIHTNNRHSPFRISLDKNTPQLSTQFKESLPQRHSRKQETSIWHTFRPKPNNSFIIQTSEHDKLRFWIEPKRHPRFLDGKKRPFPLWPVLLVMVAISLLVALYIIKPIKRLSHDIRSWHEGNFTGSINTPVAKRKDTLGSLAKELNSLSTNVHSLLEQQKQLLRDVSHELRSPMARIRVATALLKHPKTQQTDTLIDRIDDEIDNLDHLVGELLTLQRWQRPDHKPNLEKIDLIELIQKLIERLSIEAEQKKIQLLLTTKHSTANLQGSQRPLERSLENIVRNAIRFSPKDGTIQVTLTLTEQLPKQWLISITDQGPGVDTEALDKLFDPFFRLDNARTPGEGSFGIGLAIAREGVRINQGTIQAFNIIDHKQANPTGLRVDIRIPCKPN